LTEHSARIPQNVKDDVRKDISALNEAIVAEKSDDISEALERLKNSSMEIGKAIYSQQDEGSGSSEQQEEQQDSEEKKEEPEEEKKEEKEEKK